MRGLNDLPWTAYLHAGIDELEMGVAIEGLHGKAERLDHRILKGCSRVVATSIKKRFREIVRN